MSRNCTVYNSTYKKLAVQWLNEVLCPAHAGFSGGRQFSSPKSPTSCSCKTLPASVKRHSNH